MLLGGEVTLAELVRHELGHVVMLHAGALDAPIAQWSTIAGFTTAATGEVANGYISSGFENEQPIVASRLALGLPRGDGPHYRAAGVYPTLYASFDPVEDFAEAVRLVHSDPVALGRISPARLLVAAAGEIDLRTPALRAFVRPSDAAIAKVLAEWADYLRTQEEFKRGLPPLQD